MKPALNVIAAAILVAGVVVAPRDLPAEIKEINTAINKAGSQRMLSQRMAKAYIQLGLGVEAPKSQRILDRSITLFEQQLGELRAFAPTPQIMETYIRLDQAWIEYKKLLKTKPSPQNAQRLLEMSDTILQLAQQGTSQLEKHADKPLARVVGLSGRQRMLSQRLAKLYQAIAYGAAPSNAVTLMEQAKQEFEKAHAELERVRSNTPKISKQLEAADQQWKLFKESLKNTNKPPKIESAVVAVTSESLLDLMEEITWLYEQLPPSSE